MNSTKENVSVTIGGKDFDLDPYVDLSGLIRSSCNFTPTIPRGISYRDWFVFRQGGSND